MTKRTCNLLWAGFACSVFLLTFEKPASGQSQTAGFADFESYVQSVQSNHKAPFDRDGTLLPEGGAQALLKGQAEAQAHVQAQGAKATAPAKISPYLAPTASCTPPGRIRAMESACRSGHKQLRSDAYLQDGPASGAGGPCGPPVSNGAS